MIFYQLLIVLIVSILLPTPIVAPGRRPQTIEHNFCNLMFAEEVNQAKAIDRRATAQAYNIGINGSLCMTTCRIMSRGNMKQLKAMPSPDFIVCAAGSQFCYKGNCTQFNDLVQTLRETGKTNGGSK